LPPQTMLPNPVKLSNRTISSKSAPIGVAPWHTVSLYPSHPPLPIDPTIFTLAALALAAFTVASATSLGFQLIFTSVHVLYFTCIGLLRAVRLLPRRPQSKKSRSARGTSAAEALSNGASQGLQPSLQGGIDVSSPVQRAEDGNATCVRVPPFFKLHMVTHFLSQMPTSSTALSNRCRWSTPCTRHRAHLSGSTLIQNDA
jgi:hypothetical protein